MKREPSDNKTSDIVSSSKGPVEINNEFQKALDFLEKTSKNVFITGKAGTGKSTLLTYFCEHTRKKVVVLAPTGVAALNVGGETIHSFFKFKPDVTLEKIKKVKKTRLYKEIDTIIVDEVSMLRSDLLDCVDRFLRLNRGSTDLPFGGLQMIFIGDLYQLPPVVTSKERDIFDGLYRSPYFFSAKVMEQAGLELVELEKIYRQKDERFIGLLNRIRNNSVTEEDLQWLNERMGAKPQGRSGYSVHLTPTNLAASQINEDHLACLKEKLHQYEGRIEGDFGRKDCPTEHVLNLKIGAQVMLLNNDPRGRWVNGTVGNVSEIEYDEEKGQDVIYVELPGGDEESVLPFRWDLFRFRLNEQTAHLETEIIGSFTQYPLKLAWAVTIHKSQGKTFDRVVIDMGRGSFAHGQTYVALSRCTSFEGLSLVRPIEKRHVIMDWRVVNFITKFQYALSERNMPFEEKMNLVRRAIDEDRKLEIVYLKTQDEKSSRIIRPHQVGEKEYMGKTFTGIDAFCYKARSERVFRVDRILEMKLAEPSGL